MRKVLVAVLFLLIASSAFAGTITSLSPSSVKVNSGEYFITVYGTSPGNTLVFDGPAGHFERAVSATFTGSVVGWVPEAIVAKAGTHTVKVRDANGLETNSLNFDVVGFKFFPLALLVPEVLLVQPDTREGASGVKFDVYPVGGEDPNPVAKCDYDSGSFFKMGQTLVTCTASNSFGERADATFTINVADRVGPVVTVGGDIRVAARTNAGTVVDYPAAKAVDDIYGDMPVDCAPKAGTTFHIGKTTVTCTSADLDGNIGLGSFVVEVTSNTNPGKLTLVLPAALQIPAKDPNGEKVGYTVTVKGTKDPNPVVNCTPKSGSLFALGSTIVNCDALDVDGAWGEGSFEVSVIDANAPSILSVKPSTDRIPPDGRLWPITITTDVTDDLDLRPTCAIVGVTSNEIIDYGDTDKPSYNYNITGPQSVELRGEFTRASRVYNVWVGCSDFFGNMSQSYTQILVTNTAGQAAPGGRRRAARP
jgi:hypothetical protein